MYDSVSRRRFEHATLGGEIVAEDEDVLDRVVERVVCRWCERDDQIEDLGPPV